MPHQQLVAPNAILCLGKRGDKFDVRRWDGATVDENPIGSGDDYLFG